MSQIKSIITAPCFIPIPGGLKVGHQVLVRGRVSDTAPRFAINLQNGDVDGCDIPFHFNPRNDDQTVVRNTFQNGSWGTEERDIPSWEFAYGTRFSLRILVTQSCYSVFLNGKHHVDYQHRMDIGGVRFLQLSEGAVYDEAEVQIPCPVPLNGVLPRNFQDGDSFKVRGVVVDSNPDRFAIDLTTDGGNNVAFHFNPRQSQTDVVMNTKTNGSWGTEQRGTWCSHFDAGKYFDIVFVAHVDHFDVSVSGEYFASYNYRLPLTDIGYYNIWGDVILMDVDFGQCVAHDQVKATSRALEVGDVIAVDGYFHGDRFHVNLLNGTDASDDVAIHFNPRRDDGQIVFNTKVSGSWQTEERIALPGALGSGQKIPFYVEIVCLGTHYDIYLDGHKIYTFNDRNQRPVTGVHCDDGAYFHQVVLRRKTNNPVVHQLPKPLEAGTWMSVVCMPHANSDRIVINLQDTDSQDTANDVIFHFNPRFVEPVTVCNTFQGGSWGTEERKYDDFPFQFLERYEVDILTMDNEYRVFVNGSHYLDYAHRISRSNVSHLRLDQDCDFHEPNYHF